MARYEAIKITPDAKYNSWGVWDYMLGKLLGNGKEEDLKVSSESEAEEIIEVMVERVAA